MKVPEASLKEPIPDHCPHCASDLEIMLARVRPGQTAMVAACPNCAIAFSDVGKGFADLIKLQMIGRAVDWLSERLKHVLVLAWRQ